MKNLIFFAILLGIAGPALVTSQPLRGEGIPHPPLIIYGTVYQQQHYSTWPVREGTVILTLVRDGVSRSWQGDIIPRDDFNYTIEIPAEITIPGFTAAGGVTDLSGEGEVKFRLGDDLWISVGGQQHPARIMRTETGAVTQARSAWGGARRLDIQMHGPATDTDGDGLPDGWEAQYDNADPLVADKGADKDSDGEGNDQEFLNGTNPDKTDHPSNLAGSPLWVAAGARSQVRFPLTRHVDLEAAKFFYKLSSAPAIGTLEVRQGDGSFKTWAVEDKISEAAVREGNLVYRAPPGEVADQTFDVDIVGQTEPIETDLEVVLKVWSPHLLGEALDVWFDAAQEDGGDGLVQLAAENNETWQTTGAGTVSDGGDSYTFDQAASVRPADVGTSPFDSATSSSLYAAFNGSGAVFSTPTQTLLAENGLLRVGNIAGGAALPLASGQPTIAFSHWQGDDLTVGNLESREFSFLGETTLAVSQRETYGGVFNDDNSLSQPFDGTSGEVLGISGDLRPTQRALLESYLLARWSGAKPIWIDAAEAGGSEETLIKTYSAPHEIPAVFVAWHSEAALVGANKNDRFYVGGGKHDITGQDGADEVIFLLAGGQEHVWKDFDPDQDFLNLETLFPGPTAGDLNDHLKMRVDGNDAILDVYLAPDAASPDLSLRLTGRKSITQTRLHELVARRVIRAGDLSLPSPVSWTILQGVAEELTGQHAHVRLNFQASHLPESLHVPVEILNAADAEGDFTVEYRYYDTTQDEWKTADLTSPVPVPDPAHPWIDFFIHPEGDETTDADRQIRLALGRQPRLLEFAPETEVAEVALIDGLPQVGIKAMKDEASKEEPAMFRVSREGATDYPLAVDLRVEGTAANGTDFSYIGSEVVIPKDKNHVDIPVRPLRLVVSEEASIVSLRILPKNVYEIAGTATAEMNLATASRSVFVEQVELTYNLNLSGTGQFLISRESPTLSQELLVLYVHLGGTIPLSNVQVNGMKMNGTQGLSLRGDGSGTIILMPGESFIFLNIAEVTSGNTPEAQSVTLNLSLPEDSDYEIADKDKLPMMLTQPRELLPWARTVEPGLDEELLKQWLKEDESGDGLTRFHAYLFGLDPREAYLPHPAVTLADANDGRRRLIVPLHEGAIDARVTLQYSDDMTTWQRDTNATYVRSFRENDHFYREYEVHSTVDQRFYRLVGEPLFRNP